MKALFRVIFVVAMLSIAGCSTGYEIYDPPPREPPIPETLLRTEFAEVKVLNATSAMLKILRKDFENAPPAAQLSVNSIALYARPDEIHFEHREAAHCHKGFRDFHKEKANIHPETPRVLCKKSDICIDASSLYPGLLRHEMAHAQIMVENISLDKFAQICAGKYAGKFWKVYDIKEFPRDGFLRPYDTKDKHEHSANLVETVHCFILGFPDHTTGFNPFRGVDFKDGRYQKQIDEVYRLGLISKTEHDTVNTHFQKHKK